MKLQRLTMEDTALLEAALELYESSFPPEERRDRSETERALGKDEYKFSVLTEDGKLLGIMLYWTVDELIYLEHFAILPSLRNKGVGTKALELLKLQGKTVILEIEPPVDELTTRRYGFYKRNGFVMTSHYHIQAKYHLGDPDLELKILSYPEEISREEYLSFYNFMSREIGIVPSVNRGVTVRKMLQTDDKYRVAELIYETDPYIYPYWFDSVSDGARVIKEMIDLPTLYNIENVRVAVTEYGEIAGMAVSLDTPFTEEREQVYRAFELAGVKRDKRTDEMFDAYYAKMGKDSGLHYISNIVVHKDHRKKGVAAALIKSITEENDRCFLECVQKNSDGWRLYQRLGFNIECEYPGVFDVPCFKMTYKKGDK